MNRQTNWRRALEPQRDPEMEPNFGSLLRGELRRILDATPFSQSPTLAKLLLWLVDQTCAGKGDSIKSYTVAVDALGKPEDFDPQADSYPRVQMARLRKGLDSYYARHGPLDELCLYFRPGSYRARLGRPAFAYPQFYRPIEDPYGPTLAPVSFPGRSKFIPKRLSDAPADGGAAWRPAPDRWLLVSLILLLLTVAGTAVWQYQAPDRDPQTTRAAGTSPTVEFAQLMPATGAPPGYASAAHGFLIDGFSRSWVARLRTDPADPAARRGTTASDYRIETQLGGATAQGRDLFVRLYDAHSATLIWSDAVALHDGADIADPLAPVIAELAGPFGVIASAESRRLAGHYEPGYPCIMGYLAYAKSREAGTETALFRCLAQPSPEPRLESVRLALQSAFTLEGANVGLGTDQAMQEALALARQAIERDPKEAYAQFTYARALFARDDCAAGHRHGLLAAKYNPYDPLVLAVIGGLDAQCGYASGSDMIDRAFRYRVDGASYARLALIIGSIYQQRSDRLRELSEPDERMPANRSYHHLCETLIAAGLDRRTQAIDQWQQYRALAPDPQASTDDMLRLHIFSPTMRRNVARFLAAKGVTGAPGGAAAGRGLAHLD